MPLEYYYNGHLRWPLCWENPNHTAAFLACLLGWLWWLGSTCKEKTGRRIVFVAAFWTLCAIELAVWFLLAKTYSRGGLVAALAGMLFFFALHGLRGMGCRPVWFGWHGRLARVLGVLAVRVTIITVICAAVGFSSRISPHYVMQDSSVLNRLELWKGALVMLRDSPFHGWGRGLGGMAYVNWYQPLDATTQPIGFVNSYLEVAVEYGTHVLFVILACALALVLFVVKQRGRHGWVLAGGSVLIVWLTANLLTSLWTKPSLWILPALAVICILAGALRAKQTWKPVLAVSAGASLIICSLLVFAGGMMSKKYEYRASPLKQSDAVLVTSRGSKNIKHTLCEIRIDGTVFGVFWGRTLRAMLDESTISRLIVYAPWALAEIQLAENPGIVIYSGFQAEAIGKSRQPARRIIILHPTGFPPVDNVIPGAKKTVCLPAVDTTLTSLPWRIWGAKHAARLIHSPQGGIRITPSTNLPFWRALLTNE
jgi:O-antigen ligase